MLALPLHPSHPHPPCCRIHSTQKQQLEFPSIGKEVLTSKRKKEKWNFWSKSSRSALSEEGAQSERERLSEGIRKQRPAGRMRREQTAAQSACGLLGWRPGERPAAVCPVSPRRCVDALHTLLPQSPQHRGSTVTGPHSRTGTRRGKRLAGAWGQHSALMASHPPVLSSNLSWWRSFRTAKDGHGGGEGQPYKVKGAPR